MGYRLYLAFIQQEGGLDQGLAVSGRAGVDDLDALGQLAVNVFDRVDRRAQRVSLVIVVEGIQQGAVLAYQGGLGGGGAGINPKEGLACIGVQILNRNLMLRMALGKFLIICLAGE